MWKGSIVNRKEDQVICKLLSWQTCMATPAVYWWNVFRFQIEKFIRYRIKDSSHTSDPNLTSIAVTPSPWLQNRSLSCPPSWAAHFQALDPHLTVKRKSATNSQNSALIKRPWHVMRPLPANSFVESRDHCFSHSWAVGSFIMGVTF
jgi:hypothetical protein